MTFSSIASIFSIELRQHYRSRRTVVTVTIVTFVCTNLSFNALRVTDVARGRQLGTHDQFYLRSIGNDLFFPVMASVSTLQLFLVCFATLLGAGTIVGGREDGTLRTHQSLPVGRRAVFLGHVLARLTVVATVLAIVYGLTLVQAYRSGLTPSLTTGVTFIGVVVVHLAGFVVVGVALSTIRRRRSVVFAAALVAAVGLLLVSLPLSMVSPRLTLIGPGPIFSTLVASLDDRVYTAFQVAHGGGSTAVNFTVVEIPFYASTSAALLSQALWIVIPTVSGLIRYERCDIN
ncbi:ABC transporter permease [Halovivax cerinus]|uniref:ABC transporter permease n=1 Tax=Halovivax cerinus TaxID=1487865 RepID=A0ABD5NLM7_9EURY|nr:ABC transporter permease [Halovivax cerinus]